jgi:hypothetical protein
MKRKLESQEEEEGSAMGDEIHLSVDVVGKILEFLPFDLLSARLVSKTWYKASVRVFAPRGLRYAKMLEAPLTTVATSEEKGMALFKELEELEEQVKERKLAVGWEVMETMKRSGASTEERWERYCIIYKDGPIHTWIQHIEPKGLPGIMEYDKMWYDKGSRVDLARAYYYIQYMKISEEDKDKYREHIMETGWTGCFADW